MAEKNDPGKEPLLSEEQVSDIRRIVKSKGINESILNVDNGAEVAILSIEGWEEKFTIIGNDISWRVGLDSNDTFFRANEELYKEVGRWAELLSLFITDKGRKSKNINKGGEADDDMSILEDLYSYKHPRGLIFRDKFLPNVSSTQSEFSLGITLDNLDYKTHDIFAELRGTNIKVTKGYISTGSKVKAQFFIDVVYMKSAYDDINTIIHSHPPFNRNQNLKEFDILLVCRDYKELHSQIEISDFDLGDQSIAAFDKAILVYNNPITLFNIEYDRLTKFSILNEEVTPTIGATELATEITGLLQNIENNERGRMVGIFGQWGRGKTFLWKQIYEQLNALGEDNPFITLEFHAWKYQDTNAVWAYLYEQFSKKYIGKDKLRKTYLLNKKRHGTKDIWFFLLTFLITFGGVFIVLLLTGEFDFEAKTETFLKLIIPTGVFTLAAGIYRIYKTIEDDAKNLFSKYSETVSFNQHMGLQAEVQKELITLLKQWIPVEFDKEGNVLEKFKDHKRILLFVDDIDRCSEDKIIQIIDALKVMLEDPDISRRVLVLTAIDERMLKRAINVKYKDMVDKDMSLEVVNSKEATIAARKGVLNNLVREYMDKLFIAGIKLGPLTADQRNKVFDVFAVNREKPATGQPNESLTESTFSEQPNQGSKASTDSAMANDTSTDEHVNGEKNKPAIEESDYTLSNVEYEAMKKYLRSYYSATPRSNRIYYFRYLFGRNLLHHQLSLDSDISKEAKASIEDLSEVHNLLAAMLVHYGQFGLEDFAEKRRTIRSKGTVDELQYCGETFSPSWQLYYVILEVVEMTVAY